MEAPRMQDIIDRLRAGKKNDEGFTLIELLVVVVIIGVLVAIAVPVYLNYRQGAADKAAQSDVRGAISAVEQFYTANSNTYPKEVNSGTEDSGKPLDLGLASGTATQAGKITVSDGTLLGYVPATDSSGSYKICARNTGGTEKKWFLYDSKTGGSVTEMNGGLTTLATCSGS
ncbi:prepilin-type N-terminal cleavage/methylation domain-containing protein [Actinoplanes sp. NPDC049802]|uniref:prepilin-type N-terminal cleavage/methylation domain-containing protein n=1 Tax=Actinoplanes sp. NPDC049802 TaxID=3154742 RepID=UPI003406F697